MPRKKNVQNKRLTKSEMWPLDNLIKTHMQIHNHIFNSTSILLVVTSIIFSLTSGLLLNKFGSSDLLMKSAILVLIISSMTTLIICLFILRPALKHGKGPTEFYYMDVFSRFKNKEHYMKRMYEILNSDKETIKFFVDEYYELGEKVLYPDFKRIKLATEILIFGIILSALLFVVSFII